MLIFLFSLNLLENVAYWTGFQFEIPHIINTTQGFIYLYGPILYWYVLNLLYTERRLTWWSTVHIIPFVIYTYSQLDFYLLSAEHKVYVLNLPRGPEGQWVIADFIPAIMLCSWLTVYVVVIWRTIVQYRGKLLILPVLKKMVWSFTGYVTFVVLYFVLNFTIDFEPFHDYIISLAAAFLIYQIGYFSFLASDKIHGYHKKVITEKKYQKSSLSRAVAEQHAAELLTLIEEERLYLNAELRLRDVADQMNLSPNHLSQIVNGALDKSFNELINEYRVQQAIELLTSPDNNDKILAIAFNSGFNNKTSFNNTFKRITGHSPQSFRRNHSENISA